MAHWNHRVIKIMHSNGQDEYQIREVYYNEDGSIFGHTESPEEVFGGSVDDLRQILSRYLKALDQPALVAGEIEFYNANGTKKDENL